ncbi:hypothetical protein [Cellulophaga tyrosinoxydans]|uniref:Uncharacterized protein n=1 Tax=Cellulophaga tyrosinoxydans TaxID=504486 RepID=A0A1W2ASX6_9FLAO|nr:hypothetical protein [Cellulophaga tyrosinoxydans]SMC63622.1 hypothetical protein SAMN05660703_2199 [Cellulophaga tyrosinoxydans]
MRNLMVLFTCFITLHSVSQSFVRSSSLSEGGGGGGTISAFISPTNGVDMSKIYLFDSWSNNAILTLIGSKNSIELDNINFNTSESKFATKMSNDSVFTFYNLKKVSINNKTYINYNDTFFLELVSLEKHGDVLQEFYLKEEKAKVHATTNTILEPKKVFIDSKFYLKSLNNELIEFKLNKKSILNLIDESKRTKVNTYVKDNRLKYNNIVDVKKVFTFYNTI